MQKDASNDTRPGGHEIHLFPLTTTMDEAQITNASVDTATEAIPNIMNPATFVAPDSQLTPGIIIEFCDRVRIVCSRLLVGLSLIAFTTIKCRW